MTMDPSAVKPAGATISEGVLANFFSSLLSKETGGQADPPPEGGSPQPDDYNAAVRSDAAAGLDKLTRLLEGCRHYSPTSSRSSFVLSVTSVMLTGTASLAVKAKKLLPVTGDQAVKFVNALASLVSVPAGTPMLLFPLLT